MFLGDDIGLYATDLIPEMYEKGLNFAESIF